MNWIGGARSRIKRKEEERQKQKKFFAKMKQAKTSQNQDSSKHLMSKDLLLFQTVDQLFQNKQSSFKPPLTSFPEPLKQITWGANSYHRQNFSDTNQNSGDKMSLATEGTCNMIPFKTEKEYGHYSPPHERCFQYPSTRPTGIPDVVKADDFTLSCVSEDFQDFSFHPSTHPDWMKVQSNPITPCTGEVKHRAYTHTQEPLMFSGASHQPKNRLVDAGCEKNQGLSSVSKHFPELRCEKKACVYKPYPVNDSSSDLIFYDSNNEAPAESYPWHSQVRRNTWGVPLKPEWLSVIKSTNGKRAHEGGPCRSKPYSDCKIGQYSWREKEAGHRSDSEIRNTFGVAKLEKQRKASDVHMASNMTSKWDNYKEDTERCCEIIFEELEEYIEITESVELEETSVCSEEEGCEKSSTATSTEGSSVLQEVL